jgi:hypothetical protein
MLCVRHDRAVARDDDDLLGLLHMSPQRSGRLMFWSTMRGSGLRAYRSTNPG